MSAYVISCLCSVAVLVALVVAHANGAEARPVHYGPKDSTAHLDGSLAKRQIAFPFDQFFQRSTAELTAASENDFDYDLGSSAGPPSTASQIQAQPQPQLPQVISNLIIAAAVQQPPAPQQLVRTVMNSGLRR